MHLPNRFTFCERSEVTSSTFYVPAYRRRLPPTRVYFSSFSTLLPILTTPLNLTLLPILTTPLKLTGRRLFALRAARAAAARAAAQGDPDVGHARRAPLLRLLR